MRLIDEDSLAAILGKWASAFNGVAVIVNRATPFHRDTNSKCPWYDMLVTVGTYEEADMELPGYGIRLEYRPGSAVALCGAALSHGVEAADGDRVSYAWFMRSQIHMYTQVKSAHWAELNMYSESVVIV